MKLTFLKQNTWFDVTILEVKDAEYDLAFEAIEWAIDYIDESKVTFDNKLQDLDEAHIDV